MKFLLSLVVAVSLVSQICSFKMTSSVPSKNLIRSNSKFESSTKRSLNMLLGVDMLQLNNLMSIRGGSAVASKILPFLSKPSTLIGGIVIAVICLLLPQLRKIMWTPTRTYDQSANSVGREYDAWTTEGILEYYWGEHIHLGYYSKEEMKKGYLFKNFIQAKYDFIDRMLEFGKINIDGILNGVDQLQQPIKVLDVGCGIGGTSRYIAKKLNKESTVTGITLSTEQVKRGTQLAKDRGITNANFQVMDALNMTFPDDTFDIVWACESGEHMPDKKKYVEEMTRVLKPGGRIVIATWCQRDDSKKPFDEEERKMLDFLYAEWTHPYFISIQKYAELMQDTKKLADVQTDDWMVQTLASWRHSIWVGVFDPWPVVMRPYLWYKCFRDGLTLERMHQAFASKLMEYGMMTAIKKKSYSPVKMIAPPTVSQ